MNVDKENNRNANNTNNSKSVLNNSSINSEYNL